MILHKRFGQDRPSSFNALFIFVETITYNSKQNRQIKIYIIYNLLHSYINKLSQM